MTLAKTCDGSGTCVSNGTQGCPNGCSGAGCAGGCTPGSCAPTEYCASGGACVPKKSNGVTCGATDECSSGYCASGVCCNNGCEGGCQECSSGTCANVAAGQDPKGACPTEPASTCGTSGECDGSGACAKWPSGTVCVGATCSGEQASVPARTCDGSGACSLALPPTDCIPYTYKCVAGVCLTSCTSDDDCTNWALCIGGQCLDV
jgi:hypothetical protein